EPALAGTPQPPASATPDDAPARPAEEIIQEFENEAQSRRLEGWAKTVVPAAAVGLSLYALYFAVAIVPAHFYRATFLLLALVLTFLY
ncbi:MAG: hypothetical protein NTZ05_13400, partial [Chloroflexi bacterium]|nr:hypothetical protein [Chloroflexota bacterium]